MHWIPSARRWIVGLVAAGAVLAVALTLRLRAVERLPVDYDEDNYLAAAQAMTAAIRDGDWFALTGINPTPEHPQFAKLAYAVAIARLPATDPIVVDPPGSTPRSLPQPHLRVARQTAALFGALTALALALLDPLAGLFLALHTFTIKYTSQVMLEALPVLTGLLSVMAYTVAARRRALGQRAAFWLALSAVLLGLTAAAKYMYAVAGVAIVIDWLLSSRPPSAWSRGFSRSVGDQGYPMDRPKPPPQPVRVAAWLLLAAATFLLAYPYLWPDPINRLWASVAFHGGYATGEHVRQAGLPIWQPLSWLFQSVPWHFEQRVFVIYLDLGIALLAIGGLKRLWQRQRVFALWLIAGLAFLFLWPTKWPQYILMVTAPVSLAAAHGFRAHIAEPAVAWARGLRLPRPSAAAPEPDELRQAWPWLLPGAAVLALIAVYPMIYQAAVALTDLSVISLRDGINGGVWREVARGLTGQVQPLAAGLEAFGGRSREVHYAGPLPFLQTLAFGGGDILVFNVLWTVLSVGCQAALGLAVALLLARPGVRFANAWRALFIVPWAIPEFVGALVWLRFFQPETGWLSLAAAHLPPGAVTFPNTWQNDPNLAFIALLIAATWAGFPFMMLAAGAGLKLIPPDAHEAAALDGASGWETFRSVTWPLLLPLFIPAIIVRAIFAFNQFYLFLVMRPPYPLSTLAVASYDIFSPNAPGGGRFALSAVVNLITVLILALLLAWFNRRSRAVEGVTYA
jgi:ABC-type sugar transport system permease subunit